MDQSKGGVRGEGGMEGGGRKKQLRIVKKGVSYTKGVCLWSSEEKVKQIRNLRREGNLLGKLTSRVSCCPFAKDK